MAVREHREGPLWCCVCDHVSVNLSRDVTLSLHQLLVTIGGNGMKAARDLCILLRTACESTVISNLNILTKTKQNKHLVSTAWGLDFVFL